MGFKNALIGAFIGLAIGGILMFFILSKIGSQFDPMTYEIFMYGVPIIFGVAGALTGYNYE